MCISRLINRRLSRITDSLINTSISLQTKGDNLSDDPHTEYRNLLLDMYKENQSFLNKAVFSVSTIAVPLLFQTSLQEKTNPELQQLLLFPISFFSIVIGLHVLGLQIAKVGCDIGMNTEEHSRSDVLFNLARLLDILRDLTFFLALAAIPIIIFFNNS